MPITVERLKRRADFLFVAGGRKHVAPGFVLQARQRKEDPAQPATHPMARIGFTATRKIGSAVVRNRARRRLREAARVALPAGARPGCDYVLVARAGTLTHPYATLLGDLQTALHALAARSPRP